MNTTTDTDLDALDRFVSGIYWADDDLTLGAALSDALDEWTATAAADHNNSESYSSLSDTDSLAAALHELLAAVTQLRATARPGLTVTGALCEALADWNPRH